MNNRGFTLLELMVVITVIGILAGIAYPSYIEQMQKSRRSDATTALLGLQQIQEKLRANCNVYAKNLNTTLVDADSNTVAFACTAGDAANTSVNYSDESVEEWYDLIVTSATDDGLGYVAVASAKGKQASDSNCLSLVLTVNENTPDGAKTSMNATTASTDITPGGTLTTGCW